MKKATPPTTPQPEAEAPPTPAPAVRVRVLKTGLRIGTSTAARGAVVNVTAADAAFFEGRGEVVVLGPV